MNSFQSYQNKFKFYHIILNFMQNNITSIFITFDIYHELNVKSIRDKGF